jgi:hypothetical protein
MASYGRTTRLGQNEILTRDLGARDGGIGRGGGRGEPNTQPGGIVQTGPIPVPASKALPISNKISKLLQMLLGSKMQNLFLRLLEIL